MKLTYFSAIQRRGGSYWTTLAILGLVAGLVTWGIGITRGFDQGFSAGIQATETGQAELNSVTGGFAQYFTERARIEGIRGVVATSARLEFPSVVLDTKGQTRAIRIRAVNFSQENKVTGLLDRVENGISGPMSGLLIPKQWVDLGFLYPSEKAQLLSPDGTRTEVPVNGIVDKTYPLDGTPYAILDLETAQTIVGPSTMVKTFAIRLSPGTDPAAWVADNKGAFVATGAVLEPWTSLAAPLRSAVVADAQPFFLVRDLILLSALVVGGSIVWLRLHRQQHLLILPPKEGRGFILSIGVLVGTALITWFGLAVTFPLAEATVLRNAFRGFPFYGPHHLTWGPGWELVVVPAILVVGCIILSLGKTPPDTVPEEAP